MKSHNILVIFVIALFSLLSLQAFWLYYTYQLHLRNIKKSVNEIFYQSVEKELDQRFLEMAKKVKDNLSDANIRISTFKVDYKGMEKNCSVSSQQFSMAQQLMKNYDIHFNIINADSIFHSLLQSKRYPFQYQIFYADSLKNVIEISGQEVYKGFTTDVFSIINGEKTYATVKVATPVVFKNMLAILIVSILIFVFIFACLIYEIKILLNQHHLIRLRENFTYALTHDMNTPLTTIHSVLIELEKGTIDKSPEIRQKFSVIAIDQVLNLQAIINRVLTLAYIEKRQLSLNKQSIDLPEMIQSLIDKFSIRSYKIITFQTFFDLKDATVYADSFYLKNVISNLIDNAIKYSGDSVSIGFECTTEEKEVYIRVKDNGFGISLTDQLKIFKRFERGSEIRRNRISGFGIGLNYVQQVIEAHEGKITVSSQKGIGSVFTIVLPSYYIKCENFIN